MSRHQLYNKSQLFHQHRLFDYNSANIAVCMISAQIMLIVYSVCACVYRDISTMAMSVWKVRYFATYLNYYLKSQLYNKSLSRLSYWHLAINAHRPMYVVMDRFVIELFVNVHCIQSWSMVDVFKVSVNNNCLCRYILWQGIARPGQWCGRGELCVSGSICDTDSKRCICAATMHHDDDGVCRRKGNHKSIARQNIYWCIL